MKQLRRYSRYKQSEVEWFPKVPEHWTPKRLKTSATCWVSNVDKVPAEDELPVRLCNYTDVYYHDHITPDLELMETTASEDEIRRFGLRVGDVLITKDSEEWSDIAVPALVKKSAPDLVCGYHLAIIRSHPKALLGNYLLRAFQSCAVNQQFQVAASGVTRYGLPKASIGEAWIPLPDVAEQRAIAAFLDRETARLHRLVAKKRELIERLKEKRTALISRTVTRGLPPAAARASGLPEDPPLKPSGLDWLGDIPMHWEVRRAKHICAAIIDCKNRTPDYFDDGEFYVLRTTDVKEGRLHLTASLRTDVENFKEWTLRGAPQKDDVFFTREAPAGEAALFDGNSKVCMGQRMMYFRANRRELNPRFLLFYIYSDAARTYINGEAGGSTVTHLRLGQVYNFPFIQPPVEEQAAIAAYLDKETSKLDALVVKVEEAIERLQEYRTALITAAVTGKIDVRKISQ